MSVFGDTHCQHQPSTGWEGTGLWICGTLRTGRWLCCGGHWHETEAVAEGRLGLDLDEISKKKKTKWY